jgi:hypothetical protein
MYLILEKFRKNMDIYFSLADTNITTMVGQTSVEQTSFQQTSVGQTSVRPTAVGQTAVGQTSVGQTSVRPTAVEQTAVGQTSVGQTSVRPTAVGQTAVGQTSVGQTSVGQNPHDLASYTSFPSIKVKKEAIDEKNANGLKKAFYQIGFRFESRAERKWSSLFESHCIEKGI